MRERRSSAQGGGAHKKRKQEGENFKFLPPTSAQIMEHALDKGPNPLVQDENSNLQTSNTVDITNQRDLSQALEANSNCLELKMYSRRSKKAGDKGKKEAHIYSNRNLQKNGFCNNNLPIVESAETGFERKKNNGVPFGVDFLAVDGKQDGSVKEETQADPASKVLTDNDSNKVKILGFETNKKAKRRGRKKRKNNKTFIGANRVPESEKDVSGSMKSEIIDSVERSDLDPEICSKSEMGDVKPNSGKTYGRTNRAKKKTPTVTKDDFLDSAQLHDVFPKLLEPKNGDLCQLKCEISIKEKPNSKDEERCPYSSVKDVTDDVTSDASMKENITLNNMTVSLQRASISCAKKKLLVLDLNGLLVDVINEHHTFQRAPIRVSGKSVYKRPFCEEFLEFCFERFDVGVWSSRKRKNIDVVVNFLFREKRSQLLFCWDLSMCTTTGFNTLENVHKPLVLKELKKLWNKDEDLPWEKGDYSPSNTLLIDDSPYKALCNPPHTAIFPSPYDHRNENDYALGLGGDLRVYLEGLAMADNVQSYVREHQFGQRDITHGNPSWGFYLRIIEKMNTSFTSTGSH